MGFEEVLEKITEETELSEDEVKEEVDEKMDEFEGLVSEEGAVHLVAKEYGVEVQGAAENDLKIDNVVPEMRKVNIKARVLSISDLNTFERDDEEEDGRVQNLLLGDDTGTIRVTLWDEQTEIADQIEEGDPIEIAGAYTVEDDQGRAEIRLGDSSKVKMADEDDVPEVDAPEGATTTEASIREVSGEGNSYSVKGLLVAMYGSNPFYRVDPETGDTAREDDDGNLVTDDGKEVEDPDHRLAITGVIDDGTGAVRAVFFGDQARKILDIDEETEREGDQEAVEKASEEALGKEISIEGRTRYNDYFDQTEITVNGVDSVDAEDEIEELLDLMEA